MNPFCPKNQRTAKGSGATGERGRMARKKRKRLSRNRLAVRERRSIMKFRKVTTRLLQRVGIINFFCCFIIRLKILLEFIQQAPEIVREFISTKHLPQGSPAADMYSLGMVIGTNIIIQFLSMPYVNVGVVPNFVQIGAILRTREVPHK
jgi:hypothetical protein